MPRIAIIGAGFSGLAAAWHLSALNKNLSITLFDFPESGQDASQISAGIMHKYSGLHAKLNAFGNEGKAKTLTLLQIAEEALGRSLVLSHQVLRQALVKEQEQDYLVAAQHYADVHWLSANECQSLDFRLPAFPGIIIDSAFSIDTGGYLVGLLKACQNQGVEYILRKIDTVSDLNPYDFILLTMGAACSNILEMKHLRVHPVKGQLLELKWPEELPPLALSLVSQVYLCMSPDKSRVIVGATYEHQFESHLPDRQYAISKLLPQAIAMYPALINAPVVDVKAGLRASMPSRLPFAGHVQGKLWALTGLGSRGLLYHAFFAERLAQMITAHL